ncbi:transaldolase family protein [Blastopirellula marina]|uniref:Transaldolase n=1 Tax=Blastopirellula marina DSM 3645 TaxID=314230 RepID=A3ZLQ2_9BACT|nr:transaldolase family protein [Blastopirellula marina]EAQ82685.1 transaldolase [Blastopirellula marina DSM 3645]
MASPLESLIAAGTKLWLDSIDPDLVRSNFALGATGATSNPVIVSDLIKTGRFDDKIAALLEQGLTDSDLAWKLTDDLVSDAQSVFLPVWEKTSGNDGYVSFELDPLLEDPDADMPHADRVAQYIKLGKQWAQGQKNRMIKVPATPAGLDALEELCAAGITLNVTLIFTERQYEAARDAVWRGAQRRENLDDFKSVYSIFVSRVDVYTEQHLSQLTDAAQGQLGIVNAKRIWAANKAFWSDKPVKLQQEMIFASTGTKKPEDPAWKYVAAFAGSDIETNPPGTNDKVQQSGKMITSEIEEMPSAVVLADLDKHVDYQHLEKTLMEEGIAKFANPQKGLLKLIGEKRAAIKVG